MIEVSISVEGQTGLTWPLWRRWVAMAESRGFSGLYRSDHFTMPDRHPRGYHITPPKYACPAGGSGRASLAPGSRAIHPMAASRTFA
jgi:hypothetical protein